MTINRERRRLLEGLVALAGVAITGCAKAATSACREGSRKTPTKPGRPVVARARRDDVKNAAKGGLDGAKLELMLGSVIARATGDAAPLAAFRRLFRASDVVGIKVGTLAGPGLSPHPEVVHQLTRWLVQAGVREENIVVWDRLDNELERAGFKLNRNGPGARCLGTNKDYDWTPREWGAGGSCFANILINELTALINVAVLKDHDLAGVSAGLKNWYGVIHNPNKFHDNGCDPYIAHLAASPLIKDKLRLTVIDGLVAQCHGGPARSPRWAWPLNTILASTDPVALDTVAWRTIEERRQQMDLKTLTAEQREPKWLASAAKLGLGENRWERIELVDV
jgi:hypothetical protein